MRLIISHSFDLFSTSPTDNSCGEVFCNSSYSCSHLLVINKLSLGRCTSQMKEEKTRVGSLLLLTSSDMKARSGLFTIGERVPS